MCLLQLARVLDVKVKKTVDSLVSICFCIPHSWMNRYKYEGYSVGQDSKCES